MIDGLILSLQIFSRIFIPIDVEFSKENIKKALYFMPLVGLLIGLFVALAMYLVRSKTQYVQGGLGLLAYYLLTGGIHLDGLSDMADGFFANKDRKTTLAIMSDSFLGVFGTLSLLMYCILKFSAYTSLTRSLEDIVYLSFMTRITNLHLIKRCKMAKEEGFGLTMKEALGDMAYGLVALGLVLVFLLGGPRRLIVYMAMLVSNELIMLVCNRKIGGLTGDIFGASIEINEILGLMILT